MKTASTPSDTIWRVTATRPYHHGNLREALLEQAEIALARDGAAALSLRELSREVGVSHGAPRRHFADKQALLDALSESGFTKLGAALHDAIARAGPDFDTRMSALARAYVRFATEHAALLELMFASKHLPGADRLHEASAQAFAPALELIAEGQAAGAVVPGDLDRVAMVAFAGMHGIAALANSGLLGDTALDELVDDAVERLALGLRPR
jgi:AcrR family transcriptional regulator